MDGLEAWAGFNGALAAASSALAGLIMVVLSVNVREVLAYAGVSARAAAALALLVLTLVCSLLGLMPGQALAVTGALTLAGCVGAWAICLRSMVVLFRHPSVSEGAAPPAHARLRHVAGNAVVFLGPLALFSAGGLLLALGLPAGASWIAFGSIGALAGSMMFSWVALIEILR